VRSGVLPLTGWGIAVAAIAALGAAVFGLDLLPALLLAGAGACAAAAGVAAGIAGRRGRADGPELVVRGSAATTVVVAGVACAVVGAAAAGPAFLWPGLGLIALGAGGLVREWRAGRRMAREGRR